MPGHVPSAPPKPRRPARIVARAGGEVVVATLALMALVCIVLCVDIWTLGLMGAPWYVMLIPAAIAVPFLVRARRRELSWTERLGCVAVAVALLAIALPWHGRKWFMFDLTRVDPGMTVVEVDNIMSGWMKGPGSKWLPGVRSDQPSDYPADHRTYTGTMVYRWSDDGAYDSDFGVVTFENGRVTEVDFWPD